MAEGREDEGHSGWTQKLTSGVEPQGREGRRENLEIKITGKTNRG